MKRKEVPADYEAALKNCFDRWEHLREYGGSDPTYSDGVNMNLVRNHIMYYKEKIEETLPPYPEIYHRETPPKVDMDYIARPDEIRENAKISLAQFDGNDSLRYLREAVRELTDTQADRLHIQNILGYETALRMAIAEDDLITMRRYENPERYLQSFEQAANAVRQLEPEEDFQMRFF